MKLEEIEAELARLEAEVAKLKREKEEVEKKIHQDNTIFNCAEYYQLNVWRKPVYGLLYYPEISEEEGRIFRRWLKEKTCRSFYEAVLGKGGDC